MTFTLGVLRSVYRSSRRNRGEKRGRAALSVRTVGDIPETSAAFRGNSGFGNHPADHALRFVTAETEHAVNNQASSVQGKKHRCFLSFLKKGGEAPEPLRTGAMFCESSGRDATASLFPQVSRKARNPSSDRDDGRPLPFVHARAGVKSMAARASSKKGNCLAHHFPLLQASRGRQRRTSIRHFHGRASLSYAFGRHFFPGFKEGLRGLQQRKNVLTSPSAGTDS